MSTILKAHEAAKTALIEQLRALSGLASESGMKTLHADLHGTRIPKLEEGRFNLVVLGEFNHGKSTFVNALLGAEVLPVGITPTTATINHVIYAKKARARAVMEDGGEVQVDPKKLADWVTVDGTHTKGVKFVEVGYPAALLEDRVTLVDTPGVNDLNEQRAEVTYGYVPRADAVIFLLDAGQALKESERAFLTSRLLERSRDRLIFVVGKIDLLDKADREEMMAYVREHLGKIVPEPPIFAVSAKRHLAGDEKTGPMQPLLQHLAKVLTEERGRVLLDNAAADGLRAAAYLKQNLGVKRQALELTVAELEERVARVHAQLSATQKNLAELHQRIQAEAQAVKAQIRLDLESFASRFEAVIPVQIDAVDSGDVKRFLPLYIQDKFKEWAELEGDKVGALLERLAEEVIAVTNENTREATLALAERMGPGNSRLEIDVDTFKYDVSVYAVGALGTTIFLFVNSLVGGILTLAAPIMAIVFSSRISAEIKDHAKKKAPEAIRKASEAIAPQYARIVDDFATRLSDFVTSAGDKLFSGLSEVLAGAIAARRDKGDEVAPLVADTDRQIQAIDGVEKTIADIRTQLWA